MTELHRSGRINSAAFSKISYPKAADGIENAEYHNAHIRKNGQPHVGDAQSAQQQADEFDADGEENILIDDPQALPGDPDGLADLAGIVVHQDHIRGLYGSIGSQSSALPGY